MSGRQLERSNLEGGRPRGARLDRATVIAGAQVAVFLANAERVARRQRDGLGRERLVRSRVHQAGRHRARSFVARRLDLENQVARVHPGAAGVRRDVLPEQPCSREPITERREFDGVGVECGSSSQARAG